MSKDHDRLVEEVAEALRRHGQASDAMDSAASAYFGIHRTDVSLLDVLQLDRRMSAGELARAVGLSPAAVTAALDRLEAAGYVRRVRDLEDRRRVLVDVTDKMLRTGDEIYGPLVARSTELMAAQSAESLRSLRDLLTRSAELQLERAKHLREQLSAQPSDADA